MDICQVSFDNNTTADSKLTFLENDNDRENDLLYYDWSDISNFEDVDTMFSFSSPISISKQSSIVGNTHLKQRENVSFEPYQSQILRKHNCFMKSDHSSYMPALKLDAHIEDKLLYQDLLMPTTSNSINECKQNPSSSFEISAQAISNTSHGVENLPDFISEDPVMHLKEMVEIPSIGPLELANSVKEQPDDLGRDRGNMGLELHATEMNFTVGTSSSVPSVFSEDASVKAISFLQLQDVIGQKKKQMFLVISRSAVYMDMDMETETNPIDRSVAHLLFHRQTESANRFADDAISVESHMVKTFSVN
ncbi:hypothetical protein GW17_00032139, partial [Ensete ventricosum]